jgi:hypothetical protein
MTINTPRKVGQMQYLFVPEYYCHTSLNSSLQIFMRQRLFFEIDDVMIPVDIKPLPILIASTAATSFVWLVYLVIYRLYLSPLARFPGPKIAALTHWYECYYDVFAPGGGMYMWEIEKMHKKYGRRHRRPNSYSSKRTDLHGIGPVVRINPDELHFNDFEFFDTTYASAPHKRDKWGYNAKSPDSNYATGFTLDHDLHKKRRDAIAPFLIKRSVQTLESDIQGRVDRVCQIIEENHQAKSPVNLAVVFLALCIYTVTNVRFGPIPQPLVFGMDMLTLRIGLLRRRFWSPPRGEAHRTVQGRLSFLYLFPPRHTTLLLVSIYNEDDAALGSQDSDT